MFEDRRAAAGGGQDPHRIRETRGGDKLNDPRFHIRARGQGPYADMIASMFDTTVARLGLNRRPHAGDLVSTFRRPAVATNPLSLFQGRWIGNVTAQQRSIAVAPRSRSRSSGA